MVKELAPICPTCGSYYVRDPCPACADNEKAMNKRFNQRTAPLQSTFERKLESSEPKLITPYTESGTKIRQEIPTQDNTAEINRLKQIINEKNATIEQLKTILARAQQELSKLDQM
jgi:predicted RNase H-like nuclease (RuvC/YqgF family)